MTSSTITPGDAAPQSWVDRMPRGIQPYLRLMRADRPVGFWLLMWPCLWSTVLALPPTQLQFWRLSALFFIGSILMRGAGCTWNDIADRKLDARVARTAGRPLAAGLVSVKQALAFAVSLSLLGFLVLISLGNMFAIWLGIASLVPVALYPFAKRVTHWPQIVLGLTFNWGALMGWAAVYGELAWPPLMLYGGCLFWTLGYDTIYAHMDKADDAIVGIKSTALRLGRHTKPAVALFYALFLALLSVAAGQVLPGPWFGIGLVAVAAHIIWQIYRIDIDNPASCLRVFKSNNGVGLLVFLSFMAGHLAGP